MNCSICKSPSGDQQFCQSCIDKVATLLVKKTLPSPIAPDYRRYWLIQDEVFETIVPTRDAPTEDSALIEAYSPLQAWYYVKERAAKSTTSIRRISHNDYCEWLRHEVGTIKNST